MGFISEEIALAAQRLNTSVEVLSDDRSSEIHSAIARRYLSGNSSPLLWEDMRSSSSVQNINGWMLINHFLPTGDVFMFFNPKDDPAVVRFTSGSDVVGLIGDCFRFEFYLTDPQLSFMLCCNKYDFVIGAGAARAWVDTIEKNPG